MGHEIENNFHGFSMLSFSVYKFMALYGKEFMGLETQFHGILMLKHFQRNFTGYSWAMMLLVHGIFMAH